MRISARKASTAYAIERTTGLMLEKYKHLTSEDFSHKGSFNTRLREILERFLT